MEKPKIGSDDVFRPATHADRVDALRVLANALPGRRPVDKQLLLAAYELALEGVSRWGLAQAIREILQGSLGHGFLPSPPELRREIDRIMSPHVAARRREAEAARRYFWPDDDKPRALPGPKGNPEAVARWRARRSGEKAEAALKATSVPADPGLFADRQERSKRTAADAVHDFLSRQLRRSGFLETDQESEP
ncbi:hypothetical protein R1538_18425 [Rhizobium leguminosarum]|uniref:hypothetical protein n=1 Tax=Rhizobium leguminosarum TaxID=384 RepID=UPI00293DDC99|nr:hypothetical protein [Rhizobium leguminosarum]MDV4163101.1 hypothetical protein [Rhizobium leguminosarum]MDV4172618.1 hypothetical protein [Rhizobium leguminosarum]